MHNNIFIFIAGVWVIIIALSVFFNYILQKEENNDDDNSHMD
jgi:hypothetical protein